MSNPTILFVLCVNDESMFQACFRQLASLPAPHGYHVEVLPIRQASSMTSAYNEAITHPAQFKIYLHQDTLIVKQHMLLELIPLFTKSITWHGWRNWSRKRARQWNLVGEC